MKKLSFILLAFVFLISCGPEHPVEYLTLSGTIDNTKDSIISVRGYKLNKSIKINKDGTFKDTIKLLKPGNCLMSIGNSKGYVFLKNGFDLTVQAYIDKMNLDIKFPENNEGALSNNFLKDQLAFSKSIGNPMNLFELEKEDFLKKVDYIDRSTDSIRKLYRKADTSIVNQAKKFGDEYIVKLKDMYEQQHGMYLKFKAAKDKIANGQPSPEFKDYENFKGGKNNLTDFRGKYVYIDFWATWCKPCIVQFPYLKKLEKEYKKKVTFLSISVDDGKTAKTWEEAKKLWKNAVKKYNLSGVQLFAGEKKFATDYMINTIPRFVLIDPQGVIVSNEAPRPSDPKLKQLFSDLGI